MAGSNDNQSDPLPEGDDEIRSLLSAILGGRDGANCWRDITALCRARPQAARTLLTCIDRYLRLGQMPARQYQAVRTCIEHALGEAPEAPTPRREDLTRDLASQPRIALRASNLGRGGAERREPPVATTQAPARRATAQGTRVTAAPPGAPRQRSAPARVERQDRDDRTRDLGTEPRVLLRAASPPRKAQAGVEPRLAAAPPPAPARPVPSDAIPVGMADEAAPGAQTHRPDIQVGYVLRERYELQRLLGRGGMASVYQAVDRYRLSLGLEECLLAVKVVVTEASRPAPSTALGREFHNAQRLSHPNVVNVYEIDRDGDATFYTMELLSGVRLGQVLENPAGAPLLRPYALAIIRDIGAAITHAHTRGVVHGDLKPSNVIITQDGQVRVLDFGGQFLSLREPWFAEPDPSEAYRPATPTYASCEQLERHRADPRDDIYALACIAYLLLTGKHPFDHLSAIEARARALRPRRPRDISSAQWRALRHGLAWSREERTMGIDTWLSQLGLAAAVRALPSLAELGNNVPKTRAWRRAAGLGLPLLAASAAAVALLSAPAADTSGTLGRSRAAVADTLDNAWQELHRLSPTAADASPAASDSAGPAHQRANVSAAQPGTPGTSAVATIAPRAGVSAASAPAASAGPAAVPHAVFAAHSYAVTDGEPAARIVVRRAGNTQGDISFVWWTEADTAEPDVDYSSFGRRTEHMASGQDRITVYVPIISNPMRQESTQFHVALGPSGDSRALAESAVPGASTRATVTIDRGS